jgi:hypothetical protein
LLCALCASAAALARPQGALVALPIAGCLLARGARLPWRRATRYVAVAAGPLALVVFSAYLKWDVGTALAWSRSQQAWGRSFSLTGPFAAVRELWRAPHDPSAWLLRRQDKVWLARDCFFCVAYLGLVLGAARSRVPRAWIAFGLLIILLPLGSGSFVSSARLGLLALPAYWGAALLTRRRRLDRALKLLAPLALVAGIFTLMVHYP